MIWQVTSLASLNEFILFSASPRNDNEFPIKLKCTFWPWLMAILNFWSTPKLLLWSSWAWSYGSLIYNYLCNQCLSPLTLRVRIPPKRGVFDTTLCDKVCQWLAAGRWFSQGTLVSSTINTDWHDITPYPPSPQQNVLLTWAYDFITQKKLWVRLCFLIFSRYITRYRYIFTPSICFRRTLIKTPH